MKLKNFLICFGILVLVFIGSILYDLINAQRVAKEIASYNLELSGKIIEKEDFFSGHDYGFVLIDLKKANYEDFDPRGKKDEYFFIIKDKKCLLVLSGLSEIKINDSITVSKNKYDIIRDGKNVYKDLNLVMFSPMFYNDPNKLLSQKPAHNSRHD